MITADYHLHCNFSSDSDAEPRDMIEQAIQLGLNKMCFTDHMDYDFPSEKYPFVFEPGDYFKTLSSLREEYKNKIQVLIGIELGLRPYLKERYQQLLARYDFDFVIGSSHLVGDVDPYLKVYWEDKNEKQGIADYFSSISANVAAFTGFDVYGHIDYAIRYAPNTNKDFIYSQYGDILDEALTKIIHGGIGIEANTSGYKYGLGAPHPHPSILKRYKELGGEIITIGSDGHKPEHLAYDFDIIRDLLLSLGYKYYTVYEKRKPKFLCL